VVTYSMPASGSWSPGQTGTPVPADRADCAPAAAGRIVLHAHDMLRNEHRSYGTDRISRARATARTFTPRIAIELTPGGAQAIPQAARPARAASYTSAWSAPRSGPTYIYECPICSKKFRRRTRDSALRPHKAPDGWNCSGRRGFWLIPSIRARL